MKKRFQYLLLPIITLILEILPYGAVCNFAPSPTKRVRKTFSYFDLIPFGYANFAPFLTAIITCAILAFLLAYWFTGKDRMFAIAKGLLWVGTALSLCPLFYGANFFSVVGCLITITLVAQLALMLFSHKLNIK